MKRVALAVVIGGLLLAVGVGAMADRAKDGQFPVGIGEKLDFYSEEYISQGEACWLRAGLYHPVYPGYIADLKRAYGIKTLTEGHAKVEIFLDGSPLHREIQRSIVWRSDITYPDWDWLPEEYDVKFTWYFVQFEPNDFEPGTHDIVLVISAPNPNSVTHLTLGSILTIGITVHVSE